MHSHSLSRSRAFTLIELLTVIAIIGILAAIIIPVTGQVRASARTALCVSHWRGYGNALGLFVNDNRGKLPVSAYRAGVPRAEQVWFQLAPYVRPGVSSTMNSAQLDALTKLMRDELACSADDWGYAFNALVSAKPFANISNPARLVYGVDLHGTGQWLDMAVVNGTSAAKKAELTQAVPKPHRGKVNMLYLDNHVRSERLSNVLRADVTRDSTSYLESDETTPIGDAAYDN